MHVCTTYGDDRLSASHLFTTDNLSVGQDLEETRNFQRINKELLLYFFKDLEETKCILAN